MKMLIFNMIKKSDFYIQITKLVAKVIKQGCIAKVIKQGCIAKAVVRQTYLNSILLGSGSNPPMLGNFIQAQSQKRPHLRVLVV